MTARTSSRFEYVITSRSTGPLLTERLLNKKKYRFYFMPESPQRLYVGLVVGGIARLITHSDEELDFLVLARTILLFAAPYHF